MRVYLVWIEPVGSRPHQPAPEQLAAVCISRPVAERTAKQLSEQASWASVRLEETHVKGTAT